jgi:hypothetical protein
MMRIEARVIALAAAPLLGCGGAAKPLPPPPAPLSINSDWTVSRLAVESDEAREFAACEPGLALVPSYGGVLLAGWNGWMIPPRTPPIASVACDAHSRLYAIENGQVVVETADPPGSTPALKKGEAAPADPVSAVDLPRGTWQVLTGAEGPVWVVGKITDSTDSAILRWDPSSVNLEAVYSGPHAIHAASVIGTKGIAAVLDEDLVVWEDGHTPFRVGHVGGEIDGLAVKASGDVFLSTNKGIVELLNDGSWSIVASGVHGPLRMRDDVLYVLIHDPGPEVVRLTPASAD